MSTEQKSSINFTGSAFPRLHAYINGGRRRDLEKLSPAMWQILFDVRDHGNLGYSLSGRAAHGGAAGSHMALKKRGLMRGEELTDAGREACSVEWREPERSLHHE